MVAKSTCHFKSVTFPMEQLASCVPLLFEGVLDIDGKTFGRLSSRGNFRYFESNRLGLARTQTSISLFLQYTITVVILLVASG